jgi:hypothetical protein
MERINNEHIKKNFEFWTMHFLKENEKPTNVFIVQCLGKQRRMAAVYCNRRRDGQDITPPVTIYSSHPSLLPTTLGTYLSRIMFDSLIMAF